MTPFEPDGFYAGLPYRVLADSSIEVLMPSGLVKFRTLDHLLASLGNAPSIDPLDSYNVLANVAGPGGSARTPARQLDYYSLLKEAINKAQTDSAQLRALVYERARFNFKRDVLFGHSSLGLTDLVRHIHDFELAVARIEATSDVEEPAPVPRDDERKIEYNRDETAASQDDKPTVVYTEPATDAAPTVPTSNVQVLPPRRTLPLHEPLAPIQLKDFPYERLENEFVSYKRFANEKFGILLFAFVFMGAVIVLANIQWFPARAPQQAAIPQQIAVAPPVPRPAVTPLENSTPAAAPAAVENNPPTAAPATIDNNPPAAAPPPKASPPKLPFPLPNSFGVYALNDNKLIELQSLPLSVPDPRVALSAEIKEPSSKIISSHNPAFILFRRDFRNNVPQKITLRIIAKMARETKIVNGKPIVNTLDGPWRIRSISRDLNVSPIPDQPEMIMARLDEGTSLAPGRYALVLNRTGYDFTIEGQVRSNDFCLEGFETTNGSVLTQCRLPASSNASSPARAASDQ
jgi:hypothetical protein